MSAARVGSGRSFRTAISIFRRNPRRATAVPSPEQEGARMTEELDKTEARQGDRRRTNQTVVLIGTPLAFIALGILFLIWA
jgi:hypothetical protein